jgi:hypothetical protein
VLIALQYWLGDEEQALALARMLADIEPRMRDDVVLVLSRACDCELSAEAQRTREHCERKMRTILLQSHVERYGHPDGCFGIWSGTVGRLYEFWQTGMVSYGQSSVLTVESDGCPVRADWIDRLKAAHERTLAQGLRVTGAVMDEPVPHVNGNLCMHLSVWGDHPSLRECAPGVAWDIQHAQVLLPLTRPSNVIRNEYDTRDWTVGALAGIAREAAWVHGAKDDSVLRYARSRMREWRDRR